MKNKALFKEIMGLSYPLIMENLLQVSMGFVDSFFVSKLGTESIAGVGVTSLLMNIYMSFFFAVGVGTTALVSRQLGAGEEKKAAESAGQAFLLSAVIGLVIGAVNLACRRQILALSGLDDKLIDTSLPYFLSVAVPSVFLSMSIMLSSSLRGAKDTKSTMKISVISNLVNIVLDPLLIFGVFGIPGMGILGAGVATSISRAVGVILLICITCSKKSKIRINYKKAASFDMTIMKNITRIGIPVAVERLFMRVGQLIYSSYIIGIGTKVYAAYVITGTLDSFAYIPGMAIGGAAAALVGTSLGAGDREEAYRYGIGSMYIGTAFMVVIGLINFTFAPAIADLFTIDAVVKADIIYILRLTMLLEPVAAVTLVITPALQGAGDTRLPMMYTLFGIWVFRVLGCYLFVHKLGFGITAVIMSIFVDLLLRSVLLLLRFKKREWQDLKVY
ncbi:MAG: MATE family efflux transporter [Pseudomonadota bacterium]